MKEYVILAKEVRSNLANSLYLEYFKIMCSDRFLTSFGMTLHPSPQKKLRW